MALVGLYIYKKSNKYQRTKIIQTALPLFVVTYTIAIIASILYENPRPFTAGNFEPLASNSLDNGFPSDHTLASSLIAFSFYNTHKKIFNILFISTLLVGLGRVLAGVHHSIDIMAAIIITAISFALISTARRTAKSLRN